MRSFRQYLTEVDDTELLKRFARRQGVGLDIFAHDDYPRRRGWSIEHLNRPEGTKKGAGAKVMRAIGKQADKKKATVSFWAAASIPKDKLRNYFKQFGYKLDADPDKRDFMTRKPTRKPRSK